jgi:hypothetical protein
MQAMQERCAQANIKVIYFIHPSFAAPPSVMNDPNGWVAYAINLSNEHLVWQPGKDVIDASGLGTNNFRVIYVPGKLRGQDPKGKFDVVGAAIANHIFKQSGDAKYIDTCFVTAHPHTPYIPTHEVLHLLGLGHVEGLWNLMYEGVWVAGKKLWGWKRLTEEQVENIRINGDLRQKFK